MKKIISVALLSSAVISVPALAADQGAYVAADLGQIQFSSNLTGGLNGDEAFPNPVAITVGGGYRFNEFLGVEAGYVIAGESKIETAFVGFGSATQTVKTSVMHVAAVGTFPINDSFAVFGKLGMADSKIDYSLSTDWGPSASESISGTKLMYAVGAQFNINRKFGIRAQYADFGKIKADNCTTDCEYGLKSISVGGVYNF
jgi:OOP family OmpA-OmpF porin